MMAAAVLMLERFDQIRAQAAPLPRFTAAELDEAYQRGLDDGRATAHQEQADRLCRELAAWHEAVEEAGQAAATRRAQAVAELQPLIEALFEGAIPLAAQARLQAALLAELRRLAESATPLRGVLRCGADQAHFLAACLARTGITGLDLDATAEPGGVELSVLGGKIIFDQRAAAEALRALVGEFLEET